MASALPSAAAATGPGVVVAALHRARAAIDRNAVRARVQGGALVRCHSVTAALALSHSSHLPRPCPTRALMRRDCAPAAYFPLCLPSCSPLLYYAQHGMAAMAREASAATACSLASELPM